jgi:hypothetical protein
MQIVGLDNVDVELTYYSYSEAHRTKLPGNSLKLHACYLLLFQLIHLISLEPLAALSFCSTLQIDAPQLKLNFIAHCLVSEILEY